MPDPKLETLFGGRNVCVTLLDGTSAEFKVRQVPVAEYERAYALLDDEAALTAFICGHEKKWCDHLTPESYEALYAAAQEVNAKGFFARAARQRDHEREQQAQQNAMLSALPAEALETALKLVLESTSPTSSRRSPRTPG